MTTTIGRGSSWSISICIPVHNVSDALLRRCLESVRTASGPGDPILVILDGPTALAQVSLVRGELPDGDIVIHERSVGLVAAWNECLARSRKPLAHIMHCDDAVAPEFYDLARLVFSSHPGLVAMATGSSEPGHRVTMTADVFEQVPRILGGPALARFLLSPAKPATGSFIYSQATVERAGVFSSEFPYCPDEEFALRLARFGPMAFVAAPVYLQQKHSGQHRYGTWLRDDFVDVYMSARLSGAAPFDSTTREMAERQTVRSLLSVSAWLIEHGMLPVARHQLARIQDLSPRASRSLRFEVISLMARVPGGTYLVRIVRLALRLRRRHVRQRREA